MLRTSASKYHQALLCQRGREVKGKLQPECSTISLQYGEKGYWATVIDALLSYSCDTVQEQWPAKRQLEPGTGNLGACPPSSGEDEEDTTTRPPLDSKR